MFVMGGLNSERGAKFPRKYGPRVAYLQGNLARGGTNFWEGGGQISCVTVNTTQKPRLQNYFLFDIHTAAMHNLLKSQLGKKY